MSMSAILIIALSLMLFFFIRYEEKKHSSNSTNIEVAAFDVCLNKIKEDRLNNALLKLKKKNAVNKHE